jgi:hypothetical protein
MYYKNLLIIIYIMSLTGFASAQIRIKVVHTSGDVKVRYGLEENWQPAVTGVFLKDIDSILCGENSEAVLKLESGETFALGSNAVLDVGDLRMIYEKELFLYLMSKKLEDIEPRLEKTPLRVGNVSVIHGESRARADSSKAARSESSWAERELNGALDLFAQKFYSNTIIKLHKILEKYDSFLDTGKIFFYIARSFEALELNGQAIDTYKIVIDNLENQNSINDETKKILAESKKAVERLKQ